MSSATRENFSTLIETIVITENAGRGPELATQDFVASDTNKLATIISHTSAMSSTLPFVPASATTMVGRHIVVICSETSAQALSNKSPPPRHHLNKQKKQEFTTKNGKCFSPCADRDFDCSTLGVTSLHFTDESFPPLAAYDLTFSVDEIIAPASGEPRIRAPQPVAGLMEKFVDTLNSVSSTPNRSNLLSKPIKIQTLFPPTK